LDFVLANFIEQSLVADFENTGSFFPVPIGLFERAQSYIENTGHFGFVS
jgi:hypothetical protein